MKQADMTTNKSEENQQLLNLIGDDAFARLCIVFGGTKLYVSDSVRSRQRLGVIVGEMLAEKIIANFKGVAIALPMLSSYEIEKRHQAIIEDHKNGMSQRDMAIKHDMAVRQIRRIITDA